ncbi:putative MFS transporter [Thozetella sp. PMI_491]|nr:putative MFS transporter [Thozetella sp. PMI_491]
MAYQCPSRTDLSPSHAHEEDIPGTVNLAAKEGDDTGYGQALFPVPALDPNDPLQWSNFKKTMILVICSVYSFLGNSALVGPSPYLGIWAAEFQVEPTDSSNLISYPNLAFGFSSLIWVPLYLKIGRRPVMLGTMLAFIAGLIGTTQATTFGGLMAARTVFSFASGVCEALPVQLVNDIFFIHERGGRIGYYTACLCLASFAPLPAGYMLAAGYSWRLYFYVILAFAIAMFVVAFFCVEESSYDRKAALTAQPPSTEEVVTPPEDPPKEGHDSVVMASSFIPPRKTYIEMLSLKGRVDREIPFFLTMARAFTYFLVPPALWVITTYGIYIGLGAFAMGYTFPAKIVQPPYSWDVTSSGLYALGPTLGYLIAIPFTSTSDRLAAHLTRKNGGIREAEMRLGVLLVPMLVAPFGLFTYGMAAERNLHWIAFFIGQGMFAWGSYLYFSFTIAYAVDSYFANTSEMLIAINIGKQAISFGFGYKVLAWVMESGYVVVISGIFFSILLLNNLMVIVFLIWGKNIRRFMSKSALARLHRRTMTHDEL